MAQPISNTLQNNTSLTGLLGLNPKPSTTSQASTPALIPSQLKPSAPKPSIFNVGVLGGFNPATSSFGNQPNFESLSGAKSYVPPPVTGPTYTAQGVVQSPFQTLGQQPTTTQKSGLASAPVGTTTAYVNPNANYTAGVAQAPAAPGTPTAPVASTRGLFPDVVSSLAGYGAKNAALAQNAQNIANDYGQKIATVGEQGSRFIAGQKTTGTTPVAEGNAAVTAQTMSAEQSALAQAEAAALSGVQTGISANQAGASALNSAGNLAQPQITAYGQTSFDPTTGQFAGGGSLPPEVMQQYAQMASSGQYSAIPSFITSNPVLNAQLNVAAKALNPNYTPIGAQGASSVLGGIPALTSANAAADGIKNTIQTYLQQNPTLNPSNLAAGNQLQQWIQGKQLTDPKYQTLFNYLDEYTNTLAPILGVGGDPTNLKTQIAQGFINGAASGQSISQVLDAISALATNKIRDIQSGALGNGTNVPPAAGASTGGFAETW